MKIQVRWFIRLGLILLVVGLVAVLMVGPTNRRYTCLYCKALKTDKTLWGVLISTMESNECSKWFNENYPDHEHSWKWSGSESRSGFFGYLASGRRHPVWGIHPTMQMLFLKQASSQEKEQYFNLLESSEGADSKEAYEMASKAFERLINEQPIQKHTN